MPPPILEIFMPRFSMPPWIFRSSKWTCKIQLGISIFLCTNFLWPQFFMSTLFMPSPKKLKSLCHAIFMPPPKTLCHVFMPSWRWHKKKGDGIKKKTNGPRPLGPWVCKRWRSLARRYGFGGWRLWHRTCKTRPGCLGHRTCKTSPGWLPGVKALAQNVQD